MRASGNLQLYSIILLYLSTFVAAWPWPRWLPELDALVVRADSSTVAATPTQSQSSSPKETGSASATGTDKSSPSDSGSASGDTTATGSGSNTATGTGSSSKGTITGSNTGSGSKSATTTHKGSTSYDARLPAGGVSMMTPAAISGEQFYKIGDYITFGWNYTSLEATPTAVNILASCSANSEMFTIQMNQTVANNTGAVTWDTGSYQATAVSNPLLTETYTLVIYDAASSISATAQAGYLAVFDSYTFGMYVPQAYTPLNEFQCVTCSGALSDMERRALGMVLGMCCLTVMSFTWFVGGTGIIW